MNHLYDGIDGRKVLIMESPTGTGKSLSLICGSFRWLTDYAQRTELETLESLNVASILGFEDPPWIKEFAEEQALSVFEEEKEKKRKRAERLIRVRNDQTQNLRDRANKRMRFAQSRDSTGEWEDDDEFVVEEYDSDTKSSNIRSDVLNDALSGDTPIVDEEEADETKIIYCSRTHSQISQFVNEMKKTAYVDIKAVSLGSRQTMCINENVLKLKSLPRINDRCLDMMKASKSEHGGCEYLVSDTVNKQNFTDQLHATIKDIEDIVDTGKQHHTCPYYGARHAIRPSQVITLPYNILLQKATRESYGINVKGNIVIIGMCSWFGAVELYVKFNKEYKDEAHNLVDAITSIYSVSLNVVELDRAKDQLQRYLLRYQKRLKGKNVIYIRQILLLLNALKNSLATTATDPHPLASKSTIKMVNDFVHELDIDNVNLFKIGRYLSESRLAQKLQGFVEKKDKQSAAAADDVGDAKYISKHVSTIQCVEGFLTSLTNADLEGRIVVSKSVEDPTTSSLKYLLLNPASAFRQVVEEARAVVLAGGTMEPIRDLLDELLPYLPHERISKFSCGHIIPPTSLLTLAVAVGPTKKPFDFKYENRTNHAMIDELGATVANLCTVVPGGVVCFFASYAYLDKVYKQWQSSKMLQRIENKKLVFKEPRQSNMAEVTLAEYSRSINAAKSIGATKTGALLFAVIGGKMSEGINFSDDLGRMVIVVGLPFPNIHSPELQEKMRYMQARAARNGRDVNIGNEYYENLCMKAVNQSIGRAIRHKDDYASIVLVDHRYTQARIRQKLPAWIRDAGIVDPPNFGKCIAEVGKC
ncbi:hypothetical protein PhCBS80983_g00940 [Powellomyces hirtus]|uniref:ATP-dependent DNA helicase CHL1 n=1 Tax=Powellomyces hirtus TaxID=109895 RepID=A0A507EC42_9FUNG|nr:hypothetical protein PhCBS80983_g00940 [Powellomyces hirtus]